MMTIEEFIRVLSEFPPTTEIVHLDAEFGLGDPVVSLEKVHRVIRVDGVECVSECFCREDDPVVDITYVRFVHDLSPQLLIGGVYRSRPES